MPITISPPMRQMPKNSRNIVWNISTSGARNTT